MEQSIFGHYRVLELLGRGGMGEVYRAHDSHTDRTVALKVLPARLTANEEYAARFRRECHSAARLTEAHVVPIHGFGEIDGRLYLDMRLVEGMTVAVWLRAHGPMSPEVAVAVVGQVAQALDAAHALGLVHRDVTPSNVLLAGAAGPAVDASTVFVYLFDFGIARPRAGVTGPEAAVLTRAGVVPGSPSYVAPERFSGVEGDPRADVYSLACLLHETLTARPPFTGDLPALMGAHLHKRPPRPSVVHPGVPIGFDAVVEKGMAKEPDERYSTAGELAGAARAVLGISTQENPVGVAHSPATAPTVLRKPRSNSPGPAEPVATPRTDADGVSLRFGPGVGAVPRAPGWTSRPPPPRRGPLRLFLGASGTGLVVAAVIVYLLLHQPGRLQVLGASVAPAADPGRACNVTVDVVGSVQTNGRAGVITYQWSRSDSKPGEPTDTLTQSVAGGASSTNVHLLWKLSGTGQYLATATLRVTDPNPTQAEGSFSYDCR